MKRAVRILVGALILMVLASANVYAVDVTDYGFTVRNQSREGSLRVLAVTDPSGRRYSIASIRELSEAQVERALEIAEQVFGFEYIEPSGVRIVFEQDVPEVVMIPSEFSYDGYNLVPAIPSGLTFLFGEVIEYNFRMFVDGLFLRLEGQFFTEDQFADRLVRAARNPAAFVQSQDPEFLLLRINELESQLEALLARMNANEESFAAARTEVTEAFGQTNDRIAETNNSVAEANDRIDETNDSLAETEERLGAEIESSTTALRGELTERIDGLALAQETLAGAFTRARYGSLVEHNRGFFGGVLDAPDPAVVERIVEIKAGSPDIEADAVRDLLREEEIDVRPQVIRIVFALYFNAFEE